MKTELFQSCDHCWVFQICWHNECNTLIATSFSIWNSSAETSAPPLALFTVMLPKSMWLCTRGCLPLGECSYHRGYLASKLPCPSLSPIIFSDSCLLSQHVCAAVRRQAGPAEAASLPSLPRSYTDPHGNPDTHTPQCHTTRPRHSSTKWHTPHRHTQHTSQQRVTHMLSHSRTPRRPQPTPSRQPRHTHLQLTHHRDTHVKTHTHILSRSRTSTHNTDRQTHNHTQMYATHTLPYRSKDTQS